MAARGLFKNPVFTLNSIDYTGEATSIILSSDVSVQTQKTLNPAVVLQDVDTPAWTFAIEGLQGGLSDCLTDMDPGTEVDAVVSAGQGVGVRTATFTFLAMPVDFGGEQGAYATFSATFGVIDQPVFDVSS